MTTKEQYKNRWQTLAAEIATLEEKKTQGYLALPKIDHDSQEWKAAWKAYYDSTSKPCQDRINAIKPEAEYCRIRSLDKFYCNRYLYTDIEPFEVVEVISDKRLRIRAMEAVVTTESMKALMESFTPGGFLGHFDNSLQEWNYTSNLDGEVYEVRQRKDGKFYAPKSDVPFIISDHPIKHHDYNF